MMILYNPNELEIKFITESSTSASYLDILLNICVNVKFIIQLNDKQDEHVPEEYCVSKYRKSQLCLRSRCSIENRHAQFLL